MMFFDPVYFLYLAPALILMMWAQYRIKSTYAAAMKVDARLTGAAAARHLLDVAGCQNVGIEQVAGHLSDHYDPRAKVLRLSRDVYNSRSAAAVGIAAHEAGHALQDARNYAPLVIRNAAVPLAAFGTNTSFLLIIAGMFFGKWLIMVGIAAFACVVFFQLINLPVEFDASNRAKAMLTEYQIVDDQGAVAVRKVLNAAGWTYVAATLQSVMTLLYLLMRFAGGSRD